jgi:hypothetical protein
MQGVLHQQVAEEAGAREQLAQMVLAVQVVMVVLV